ncbi:hypothetical protein [Bailinhaonella thermotolerans]|uniref:Uncharacterized protein n=1 Tax=Bailinhaonella thermotolerans TaxID=1070861 RepID=A0A3A4A3W1_9ACTN|nr:hypothetical protein [Bailinhaonella thermotolerans]RJL19408.1 hypothetical protein D5H75_40420 [Bailinhaonella thermotolerans]
MAVTFKVTATQDEVDRLKSTPSVEVEIVDKTYTLYLPKSAVWLELARSSDRILTASPLEQTQIAISFLEACFTPADRAAIAERLRDTLGDPLDFHHLLEIMPQVTEHFRPIYEARLKGIGVVVPAQVERPAKTGAPKGKTPAKVKGAKSRPAPAE